MYQVFLIPVDGVHRLEVQMDGHDIVHLVLAQRVPDEGLDRLPRSEGSLDSTG